MVDNDKISQWQFIMFIILIAFEVWGLIMPSVLTRYGGNDAWLIPIISTLIVLGLIYLMGKVTEKYPHYGYINKVRAVFGSFFGTILAFPLVIYFIIYVSIQLRLFSETAKLFLLPRTPLEYIMLPILFLSVFLVRSGIEPLVRYYELVFSLVLGAIIIIVSTVLAHGSNFSNLRPFFATPFPNYLKGVLATVYPYLGFEAVLVLSRFLKTPRKAAKGAWVAMIFTGAVYLISTFLAIIRLGPVETKRIIYPIIALIKASPIPGGIVERLSGPLTSLWVLFAFNSISGYFFMASVENADFWGQREFKHLIWTALPFIYLLSLQGDSLAELTKLLERYALIMGGYTVFALPIVLYVVMILKEKVRTVEN